MHPFWSTAMFWAYAFVWVPFALFVVMYAARSPWRMTAVGRGLMTLAVSITAVLTFVLVVIAFDIPAGLRDLLRGATLGSVGIAGWMQLRNLLHLQKSKDDADLPR